ncbi:hypothetical protein C6Y55_02210 [Stenotrophomonas maltophilia]|nr:hypothetical protein C6Y55_02210 [Stenotrophomonas maltophilia]
MGCGGGPRSNPAFAFHRLIRRLQTFHPRMAWLYCPLSGTVEGGVGVARQDLSDQPSTAQRCSGC